MRRFAALSDLAPTPEEREGGGHAAADEEASRGGRHDRRALVLGELPPPVGELADLALEVVQRIGELAARGLHGAPDLRGRACPAHQPRTSSSTSRVFFASSIASSGVGGAPRRSRFTATPSVIAPRSARPPVTIA